ETGDRNPSTFMSFNPEPAATVLFAVAVGSGLNELGDGIPCLSQIHRFEARFHSAPAAATVRPRPLPAGVIQYRLLTSVEPRRVNDGLPFLECYPRYGFVPC